MKYPRFLSTKSSMNQRSSVSAGHTASLLQNKHPLLCRSHHTDTWICKEMIFYNVYLQNKILWV